MNLTKSAYKPLVLALPLALVFACAEKEPAHSLVSEAPPPATATADVSMVHQSRFSTRARVAYEDLMTLAEQQVPREHEGVGKQKVCKKALGIKLCGNARWEYVVIREGELEIQGQDDYVTIDFPMRFSGNAGLGGDVSKLLNINAMDFAGAMNTRLLLKLDLADDWCPVIDTNVKYEWTQTPRVEWTAGMGINLQDHLDKAISKQLANLQQMAVDSIDCEQFRESIQAHWRQHSIPLDLPDMETMYLNIEPNGFSFSGIKTEPQKLGLAFALDAKTSLQPQSVEQTSLPLPVVSRTEYEAGLTRFSVLIRAPYVQLQTLAEKQVTGQTFTESGPTGDVSVTINSLQLSGNPDGVTMNLGFLADLPGSSKQTPGNIYLTATPVVDAFNQTIKLDDIELSNVLDSTLWNLLAKVFEGKIITELENRAVMDIGPKLEEVAALLETQLADPARTGGLKIDASNVAVSLSSLIPEKDSLAALVNVETELEIDVPINTLLSKNQLPAK